MRKQILDKLSINLNVRNIRRS